MGGKRLKRKTPQTGKHINLHPSTETPPEQSYLVISLRYIDSDYCLTKCTQQEKSDFADKVRILTQHQWKEIYQLNKLGQGCEKIEKHCITRPIPSHISDDTNMIAFRFSGKKPMVGYRNRDVFYVLWFDRDFSLYKH